MVASEGPNKKTPGAWQGTSGHAKTHPFYAPPPPPATPVRVAPYRRVSAVEISTIGDVAVLAQLDATRAVAEAVDRATQALEKITHALESIADRLGGGA